MAVGAGVSADGKASFGAGGASGGAGLKGLIGLRKNKDGTSVGYFEVSDELAGKAGVLGSGASGSAGAKGVVAVTFDANHHATQLKLTDSIDASGGLSGVTDNTSSLAGMAQSAVFGPDQKNTGREVEATLDLTNPATHAAAANFLSAVGVNVLDGSNPRAYQTATTPERPCSSDSGMTARSHCWPTTGTRAVSGSREREAWASSSAPTPATVPTTSI